MIDDTKGGKNKKKQKNKNNLEQSLVRQASAGLNSYDVTDDVYRLHQNLIALGYVQLLGEEGAITTLQTASHRD